MSSRVLSGHPTAEPCISNEQYFGSSIPDNNCGETPQHVDKSRHLSDPTSTTDSLDESSTLGVPEDLLLELDSTSLVFQLQDASSVENEFAPELEEHLDNANLSQTGLLLEPHDYELFLLSQEIDASSDNLSHQVSHICEKLCQDDPFFTHATSLGTTFALTHFMAQHNYEELNPTDKPSTFPTSIKADNGHTLNPVCAHNPFASQVDPNMCFNSFVSPCLHSGEHILKEPGKTQLTAQVHILNAFQDNPCPCSISPLASMSHQWTIRLHDGYPPFCTLIPGESIPTSIPTLCNLPFGMFSSGIDYTHLTRESNPDAPSLDSPKGEMASCFSLSCPFQCPTSRTLCLDESTLVCMSLAGSPYCTHQLSHLHSNLVAKYTFDS